MNIATLNMKQSTSDQMRTSIFDNNEGPYIMCIHMVWPLFLYRSMVNKVPRHADGFGGFGWEDRRAETANWWRWTLIPSAKRSLPRRSVALPSAVLLSLHLLQTIIGLMKNISMRRIINQHNVRQISIFENSLIFCEYPLWQKNAIFSK